MSQENIPWSKLNKWQKEWIQHALDFQREFNCVLPHNSFTMLVCKSILRKVGAK